jgi:hypothetical protein
MRNYICQAQYWNNYLKVFAESTILTQIIGKFPQSAQIFNNGACIFVIPRNQISVCVAYIYTQRLQMPSTLHNEVYLRARKRKILYKALLVCVCDRISTMSERERVTTHAAQFHSLTQLNIMQHISRKHSERARNNDSTLSRVILRGLDSPFFLSADVYVFPYFIDVPRRSAGVLCIN